MRQRKSLPKISMNGVPNRSCTRHNPFSGRVPFQMILFTILANLFFFYLEQVEKQGSANFVRVWRMYSVTLPQGSSEERAVRHHSWHGLAGGFAAALFWGGDVSPTSSSAPGAFAASGQGTIRRRPLQFYRQRTVIGSFSCYRYCSTKVIIVFHTSVCRNCGVSHRRITGGPFDHV